MFSQTYEGQKESKPKLKLRSTSSGRHDPKHSSKQSPGTKQATSGKTTDEGLVPRAPYSSLLNSFRSPRIGVQSSELHNPGFVHACLVQINEHVAARHDVCLNSGGGNIFPRIFNRETFSLTEGLSEIPHKVYVLFISMGRK